MRIFIIFGLVAALLGFSQAWILGLPDAIFKCVYNQSALGCPNRRTLKVAPSLRDERSLA